MDANRGEQVGGTPTLSYGRRASGRKRWGRRALILAILIVVAVAFQRWGLSGLRHVAMLHARWQCARYTAPPDLVVYDEHPDRVPALLKASSDYVRLQRGVLAEFLKDSNASFFRGPAPQGVAARTSPRCFRRLANQTFIAPWNERFGLLYLGERTTPNGKRWIVGVHPSGMLDDTTSMQFDFIATTYPVSMEIPSGQILEVGSTGNIWDPPKAPVRIFAGQSDPANASRFTMDYEQFGQRGVIEGRVTDDEVAFTVLSGPAALVKR